MKFIKWSVVILLALPITAFAFYKPIRLLIPEAFGVSCNAHHVCVDDASQLAAAVSLLNDSRGYLEAQWGLSIGEPEIIFCSSEKCQATFGLGKKAGFTLGSFGIAIAPRGWKQYYVAHELIHHWQAENFGSFALLKGEPWLIEGMAYSLSNDPRKELHEPFESYRQRFNDWHHLHAGVPLQKSVGEVL